MRESISSFLERLEKLSDYLEDDIIEEISEHLDREEDKEVQDNDMIYSIVQELTSMHEVLECIGDIVDIINGIE